MSNHLPTPDVDGPHLDHEAASAALDREATPAELAHLAGCASCQARVEELRQLQELVAATPPVDAAARDRVIAAAVAASTAGATTEPAPSSLPAPRRLDDHRRRRATAAAPWLGVAAVIALLALAVPLLSGLGGDDDAGEVATSALEDGDSDGADDSAAGAATAPPAPPVDVGDLGTVEAGDDLRPVVDRALGPVPAADQAEPEAGADEEALEASGGTDGVDAERAAACEPAVRQELPDAGALLLVGTASVDDAPALVYGFAAPTERPTVLLALVGVEGCRIVTFQSYARG